MMKTDPSDRTGGFRRETYRQFGAISGLLFGWAAMWLLWRVDLVPAAVTGIVGCVIGAVTGEKFWDRQNAEADETNE